MERRRRFQRSWPTVVAAALIVLIGAACDKETVPGEVQAVREAVFRQQLGAWLGGQERGSAVVACLGTQDEGGFHGVGSSELSGLQNGTVVRSLEACESRPDGAIESRSGRPAVLIMAGPVQWRSPDEAVVEVFHYRTRTASGRAKYRLVRRDTGWVSLGPILGATPN